VPSPRDGCVVIATRAGHTHDSVLVPIPRSGLNKWGDQRPHEWNFHLPLCTLQVERSQTLLSFYCCQILRSVKQTIPIIRNPVITRELDGIFFGIAYRLNNTPSEIATLGGLLVIHQNQTFHLSNLLCSCLKLSEPMRRLRNRLSTGSFTPPSLVVSHMILTTSGTFCWTASTVGVGITP